MRHGVRRRVRRLIARASVIALVAVTLAVVGSAQPASASVPMPIVNMDSGLCLQPVATGGSIYDNNLPIWQMPCDPNKLEQKWRKVYLDNGGEQDCVWIILFPVRCGFDRVFNVFYVVNALTGSCLDVRDANRNDRAAIQQYACNGGGSEKWWLPGSTQSVGMSVSFENVRTGKCLDVPTGTLEPTHMQQYRCTANNGAQLFSVPPS
jgi:hypothetical protein